MSKKLILSLFTLLVLVFSLQTVLAEDFEVKFTEVKSSILINETAIFELNVTNNGPNIEYFTVYSPDIEWSFVTDPTSDKNMKIYPYQSFKTLIKITPVEPLNYGIYGIIANVRHVRLNKVKPTTLLVTIRNPFSAVYGSYLPALRVSTAMAKDIDPREETVIKVNLENRNKLEVRDVKIRLRSALISEEYTTSLLPLERKTLDFVVSFDDLERPRSDLLHVTAEAKIEDRSYEFNAEAFEYNIIPYGEIGEDITEESGFLSKTKTVLLKNMGNVERKYAYHYKKPFMSWIYLSTNPKATVVKIDGDKQLEWSFTVAPNMAERVVIRYNFWPFLIFIGIIVLIIVGYYIFRSPVVISKSAAVTATKDGGMWRINVQIYLKNRSNKKIKHVMVKDKVSNLLEMQQEFEVGTIQPCKVLKHDKKGTIANWDVGTLDKFEERIITYKTKAKLSILGEIVLPHSVVSFSKNNRKMQVYSNTVLMKHK